MSFDRLKRRSVRVAIVHAVISAGATAWQFYTAGGLIWIPAGIFLVAAYISVREVIFGRSVNRGDE